MLTFLTKLASGYWHIFDPQNGYTAIRCEVLRGLSFNYIVKQYEFGNDDLRRLMCNNVKVCIEHFHSTKVMANKYMQLYDRIFDNN